MPHLRTALSGLGRLCQAIAYARYARLTHSGFRRAGYPGWVTAARPLPLGRAVDVLDRFVASIRTAYPDARTVDPAGELRRCTPLISSLAVVVSVDDPPAAARVFSSMPDLARVSTPTPQQVTGFY